MNHQARTADSMFQLTKGLCFSFSSTANSYSPSKPVPSQYLKQESKYFDPNP